ncbi:MAG: dienelactone hydrolase family protein [Armatimonadetes bacterium]|nr:dienelactone hydrolase family protein [Armatimonadota bacterium]
MFHYKRITHVGETGRVVRSAVLVAAAAAMLSVGVAVRAQDQTSPNAKVCILRTKEQNASVIAAYFERMSAPQRFKFTSAKDWEVRRAEVRRSVMQTIGLDPLPERLPLKVHYAGTIDRGSYVVKRVYWQTWPNVYASGYLYMPNTPGKHPAVLNPHGHWGSGARYKVVQSRMITLARRGYVALAVDSIHTDTHAFLIGLTSIGAMTWNNMRGVDLLESLPEVDATKIGCTGASGGGQQTLYMMVADGRIKAAVPVVGIMYFHSIMDAMQWPYCGCNAVPDILRYTDQSEMCAVFAPKPVLYQTVTKDWEKGFPTGEFQDILGVYRLYKAEAQAQCLQWDWSHDYNKPMRERMYAFFDRWLKGQEYPNAVIETEANLDTLPDIKVEEEKTLEDLDNPPSGARVGSESRTAILESYKSTYTFRPVELKTASELKTYQGNLKKRLAELIGDVKVNGKLAKALSTAEILGLRAERLIVRSEPEVELPVLLFRPSGAPSPPVVVMIHPEGKQGIIEKYGGLVKDLVGRGAAVLLPDTRTSGELALNNWEVKIWNGSMAKASWDMNMATWGRPEPGMIKTDLAACLDALAAREDVDLSRAALVGLGNFGVSALFTGALDTRFHSVVIENTAQTYLNGRGSPLIANILRVADLPQIAALVAPRRLFMAGVAGDFEFARKACALLGSGETLEIRKEAASQTDIASIVLASTELTMR